MAACMFPFYVEQPFYTSQEERYVPVPCGKCPDCLKRRASQWGFRLRKEEERSSGALFVTLTYDTQFVPITAKGWMSLDKTDVQKFFKRLRKRLKQTDPNGLPLRYYICGEYGGRTKRPHYHAIVFNANELDILKAWCDPQTVQPIGNVHFGNVSGASISYTVKYINKGRWKPMHANDDRIPEFSLMSKRMGKNWATPAIVNYHTSDPSKAYITLEDGVKMAIPRYYKNLILPTTLSPTTKNLSLIQDHPSILIHLDDNIKFKKLQNEYIKQLPKPEQKQTDYEAHESKRAAIHNFAKKYSNRDF